MQFKLIYTGGIHKIEGGLFIKRLGNYCPSPASDTVRSKGRKPWMNNEEIKRIRVQDGGDGIKERKKQTSPNPLATQQSTKTSSYLHFQSHHLTPQGSTS